MFWTIKKGKYMTVFGRTNEGFDLPRLPSVKSPIIAVTVIIIPDSPKVSIRIFNAVIIIVIIIIWEPWKMASQYAVCI